MKDIYNIIKLNERSKCINNSDCSCKLCVQCDKKFKVINSKKFKFQNTELDKDQGVIHKFPKISASKFRNFYYIDRRDINFWSQLKYQRFSSIEHLTSYILESNNIRPSQLAGEFNWDLGKLPQIKYLVSKNEDLLANTQRVGSKTDSLPSNDLKITHYIHNPVFWTNLIRLYIIHHHRYAALFYLKDLNLNTIPHSLLSAIYCSGYMYFDQKSDELTEYMNQLGNRNYQRIKLKPSLANIQALSIHQSIVYDQGNISEARAILLHITKMCYMLGLHRNTKKVSKSVFYARSLIYTRILYLQLIMTKVFKVNLSFQADNPDINKVCYEPDWHLLPKETAKLVKINEEERIIISALVALNDEHIDRSLFQLIFPNIESYTNEQIYKMCIDKYSDLSFIHSKLIRSYELLLNNFPQYSKLIAFDREGVEIYFIHAGILIFEYGRSKSNGVNYKLVYKMVNLCNNLMAVILTSNTGFLFEFHIYLSIFTCILIFKHLKLEHRNKIVSNLSIAKKMLYKNLRSSNLLVYLLFDKGVELIKNYV